VTIYHLAERAHWEQALRDGVYTRSTRRLSLAEEGFIHASSAQQWPVVRRRFYGDVGEPLVLLEIDESRLGSRVVHEVGDPTSGEVFPHVYGPIEVGAVVGTTVLDPPHA
jgi:glutathione S-transferase